MPQNHVVEYKRKTASRWSSKRFHNRSDAVDFAEAKKRQGYTVKISAHGQRAPFGKLGR